MKTGNFMEQHQFKKITRIGIDDHIYIYFDGKNISSLEVPMAEFKESYPDIYDALPDDGKLAVDTSLANFHKYGTYI